MEIPKITFSLTESSRYARGILAIITFALIMGSIPTAIKEAMAHFSPSVQLAIRFAIGAIILVPFVRDFNVSLLRDGTILGLILFGCFACETIGLETISANRASFIFGLNVVFVTLFELLFGKRITARDLLASGLAFSGIAIMSWEAGEPLIGNFWLLGAAVCDAASIILLERFAPHHPSLSLTAIRIWVIAILGLLWAAPEITGQIESLKESWGVLVYLGVVATAIAFWLSTIGLRLVPAYEAAVFVALEPVFGAIIAFFLLGETLGLRGFIGAAMVLSGMLLVVSRPSLDQDSSELSTDMFVEESTKTQF
jgi:drug/metabolite transporter (DMT)-like permease